MNIKILLCNCKGLCQSFKNSDFNTLPFELESELDIHYAMLHPQLCGQGGNEVLSDIFLESAKDPETYIVSGACAPEAQMKLFQKLMRKTGFDPSRFVPVDIRGTNNQGILALLKARIETLLQEHQALAT
jgi:heterodisulfide reductase subunit A-like polyferredoxin